MNIFTLDFISLFISIAGYVIGLGAVTVIDLHGFLGRKSEYWTLATIRTHKITKPLIWIGTLLVLIGGILFYQNNKFSYIQTYQLLIISILILNGLFLSFRVSPFLLKREAENKSSELLPQALQNKIMVSFFISFFGWWTSLLLLVLYLVNIY